MNSGGGAHPKDSVLAKKGTRNVNTWIVEPLTSVKYDTKQLDGKVATIMLSRPKQRNAWTEILRNEIVYCIEQANRDPKVRAIIITGDPAGKAFCFGADLTPASANNPSSVEGDVPDGRPANESYWRDGGGTAGMAIVRSLKPVIAAINGSAVGVGMTLPLACDMTIAAADAKVGFVFGKRGLCMECLSSYFLERNVGYKIAMELVLTGRVFDARNAPPGLFNYIVEGGGEAVMKKALEICQEITETSAMSCMLNRNLILRHGYNTSPEEAHLVESKAIYYCSQNEDAKEGINAFLEKRKANYPLNPHKDAPSWFPWWKEISVKSRL